jgi:uncharacterized OB-fold protein
MSEEKKPWTGAIYLCDKCGNVFNNIDLACPACGGATKPEDAGESVSKEDVESMIELAVATAIMGCEENYIDLDDDE